MAIKLFGRPDVNLLNFARNYFQAMEDNAHYLEPIPNQEAFATMLDAFDESYIEVQALDYSVPLLDWTGDKLSELIQDQAHIHPAQMLCEGCSVAVTEHLRGRRQRFRWSEQLQRACEIHGALIECTALAKD